MQRWTLFWWWSLRVVAEHSRVPLEDAACLRPAGEAAAVSVYCARYRLAAETCPHTLHQAHVSWSLLSFPVPCHRVHRHAFSPVAAVSIYSLPSSAPAESSGTAHCRASSLDSPHSAPCAGVEAVSGLGGVFSPQCTAHRCIENFAAKSPALAAESAQAAEEFGPQL